MTRLLAAVVAAASLAGQPPAVSSFSIDFPFERIPRQLWARELVWLKNIGVEAIAAPGAQAEARSLAAQAGVAIVPAAARHVSILSPQALIESRRDMVADRPFTWTHVESEAAPEFRAGAVPFSGDDEGATDALKREAAVLKYWGPVLRGEKLRVSNKAPETLAVEQKAIEAGSAVSVINSSKKPWTGELRVALPSYQRSLEIPNVTVPGEDALLLPVDVSFADARFCRFCSGMSNSERLLYATAELTAMEYENGILSFEFYAPVAGVAVLQLEREPNGPMLAGGHPIRFDWDPESKRARLPIPAGKGTEKRIRVAVTMTAPDEVESFLDVHKIVIGQVNRFGTDYSSEALAKRSRLIAPAGWKVTSEGKSPTETDYALEVPGDRLHGEHADLRLEADGVGMSHVRVQLLRPVSVHLAEAEALHFGDAAELVSDPPYVPVEGPNGRDVTIQLRNNAPEIRTFRVEFQVDASMGVSPAKTEISIGPSMERAVSVRVFPGHSGGGIHPGTIRVSGAATYEKAVRFVVIPRGETVTYKAPLTGTGDGESVWESIWENSRIRAVFSRANGGRWIEFYWKESGKSFLAPEGVPLNEPVTVGLQGNELTIEGATGLPPGGKVENVEWTAQTNGSVTRYRVVEKTGAPAKF